MSSDNNRFIFISDGIDQFRFAMRLAFNDATGKTAKAWWLYKPKRTDLDTDRPEELLGVCCAKEFLVFAWHAEDKMYPFPAEIGADLAADFAWAWLTKQDYGVEPDHDGSNEKGFILFNESWGHVGGCPYSFIAIGPAWAMLGK